MPKQFTGWRPIDPSEMIREGDSWVDINVNSGYWGSWYKEPGAMYVDAAWIGKIPNDYPDHSPYINGWVAYRRHDGPIRLPMNPIYSTPLNLP